MQSTGQSRSISKREQPWQSPRLCQGCSLLFQNLGLALIGLIEGIGGADEVNANALAQFHQLMGMLQPLVEQALKMLSAHALPVLLQLGDTIANGRNRVVFNLLVQLAETVADIAHDIGV